MKALRLPNSAIRLLRWIGPGSSIAENVPPWGLPRDVEMKFFVFLSNMITSAAAGRNTSKTKRHAVLPAAKEIRIDE